MNKANTRILSVLPVICLMISCAGTMGQREKVVSVNVRVPKNMFADETENFKRVFANKIRWSEKNRSKITIVTGRQRNEQVTHQVLIDIKGLWLISTCTQLKKEKERDAVYTKHQKKMAKYNENGGLPADPRNMDFDASVAASIVTGPFFGFGVVFYGEERMGYGPPGLSYQDRNKLKNNVPRSAIVAEISIYDVNKKRLVWRKVMERSRDETAYLAESQQFDRYLDDIQTILLGKAPLFK